MAYPFLSKASSINPNDALSSYRKRLVNHPVDKDADGFDPVLFDFACEYLRKEYRKEFLDTKYYLDHLRDEFGYKFGRTHFNYDDDSMSNHKSIMKHLNIFKEPEPRNRNWSRHMKRAVEKLSKLCVHKLLPHWFRTVEDVELMIQDWSTSAGYLYIEDPRYLVEEQNQNQISTKKRVYLDESILTKVEEELKDAMVKGSFEKPYIIASRIQSSGEFDALGNPTNTFKTKTRMVWIEHLIVLLYERVFSIPAGDFMMTSEHTFLGKDDEWITKKMKWAKRHYATWWSLDFSNYDARVPSWLIHSAFDVLRNWFKLNDEESKLLSILEHDYIYKRVIMGRECDDCWITKGEPSGSGFTSIIGNLCHWLMNEVVKSALNIDFYYITMNDDNICFSNYPYDEAKSISDNILSYEMHNFGMVGNYDEIDCKWFFDQDPIVLSREWTNRGPAREKHALESKMLYPERFRPYHEESCKVEMVFYAYVLGYYSTMRTMFDLGKFFEDYSKIEFDARQLPKSGPVFQSLPYNMQVHLQKSA